MTQTHYDDRVTNESWRTVMIAFSALVVFMLLICGIVPARAGDGGPFFHPQFIAEPDAPKCMPHAEMLRKYAKEYRELPVGIGLSEDGNLIEIWSGPDGRSWTLVVSRPDGISCVIAQGEAWQQDRIAGVEERGA